MRSGKGTKGLNAPKVGGNKPHRGEGLHGKPHRLGGLMAGAHLPQRTNTGFDDRKGYKESPKLHLMRADDRAPKIAREHGHYHPISTMDSTRGYTQDKQNSRSFTRAPHTVRDMGSHTGRTGEGDTSKRKGPVGNSHGAPPVGKHRPDVDRHLGTAGRGGVGRIGKHDAYKGQPSKYPEDISHEAFEKLGAK